MSTDHERIDELLAGYALRALEGPDAVEADRLLLEHVPGCDRCRATLADFEVVAGDLALSAAAAAPPDLLFPSIRRSLDTRRARGGRGAVAWVAAAAMVVVLGLAGWNVLLNSQVGSSERRSAALRNMVGTLMQEDGSQMVALEDEAATDIPAPAEPRPRLLLSFQPGAPHGWVLGMDIPQPAPGTVYQLWLGRGGVYVPSERFVPDEIGVVRVFVADDLAAYDQVTVTEEPAQIIVVQPGGAFRWGGTMTSAAP